MSDPPEPSPSPSAPSAGGVFRGLAIPFSAFVLAASLALVGWIDRSLRGASLRQFEETAAANARIIDQLRLPRSPELAKNLATVLGVGVGFRFADFPGLKDEPDLETIIESLAGAAPASGRISGREVAVAPLSGGGAHLVLVRDEAPFLPGPANWLLPALIVTALAGGIAFLVSRRLVRPLQTLNRWLPNLDQEKPEPLSQSVTGRADEIGALARSLEDTHRRVLEEQALRRQSEKLATLGRIATSLAHEIKNPAAAIRLHVDLMSARAGVKDEETIDLIRDEIDRITDLINQWLFVARAAPPKTETHDLAPLLQRVCRRLEPQMAHAGVTVSLSGSETALVEADGARIEQVLRNLLLNAAQAMPRGGTIRADLNGAGDPVTLTIRDEGPGFSEEALRRWSEPFFSEREGGMGLGLTLAYEVVQAHGGSVTVGNHPDGGAEVACRFPRPRSKES